MLLPGAALRVGIGEEDLVGPRAQGGPERGRREMSKAAFGAKL